MSPIYNLAVCGGGVIGLSIAYESAKRGWSVVLIDQASFGQASSWAGAGILPASPTRGTIDSLEHLRALSHRLHPKWAAELSARTGIDTGYRRCGGIHLARTLAEYASLKANEQWWDDHGIAYRRLSNQSLCNLESGLEPISMTTSFLGAWHFPDESQLRNPHHVRALHQACLQMEVDCFEQTAVLDFVIQNSKIECVDTTRGKVYADRYCVAGGAWSRKLVAHLGMECDVFPVRGQMLLYHADKPMLKNIVNDGNRYLVPRDDGHLLVGSCEEEVGFDSQTTPVMIGQLKSWACDLLPPLNCLSIKRSWAGLRPGSFDGLPYLGQLGPIENGFVATGHFRHGIHLSPGTAKVMVDLMAGQEPEINLSMMRLSRGSSSTWS